MEFELFNDQLKALGKRVIALADSIETEEATKTSLIMPFFQILGYDIFNPMEFIPEFTADVGIKKGEKVDYAIQLNGCPTLLIEAKSIKEELTKHDSQLFRYFGTTSSKFGILTNGQIYKFFTDLDEPNKMDSSPFLVVDITKLKDNQIPEIAKFHKDNFDIDKITSSASELKYLNYFKHFLNAQLDSPSENFIKFVVGEIYPGTRTKNTLERFQPLIKKGLTQFISDKVNEKLNAALKSTSETTEQKKTEKTEDSSESEGKAIVTTPEELEAYTIVKMLIKDTIAPDRLFYRDNHSYFNILIDDNIRKWLVRVYANSSKIKLVFNDALEAKDRTTVEITSMLEIADYKDKLNDIAQKVEA